MEQQNNKTMECYRRMHQRLLEGIPADQIMREELETAFPFADDAERQQMMEGFLHSSRFFLSRMRDGQEERKATETHRGRTEAHRLDLRQPHLRPHQPQFPGL